MPTPPDQSLNRNLIFYSLTVISVSVGLSVNAVPAVAEDSARKLFVESAASTENLPPWTAASNQTSSASAPWNVSTGEILPTGNSAPWTIPTDSSQIGSIPAEVWKVMQEQANLPESYNDIFSGLDKILIGENNPLDPNYDFSDVINRDNWGISSFSDSTFTAGSSNSGLFNTGSLISNVGQAVTQGSNDGVAERNVFQRIWDLVTKNPVSRKLGKVGKSIRGKITGSSIFGLFTNNQVIKNRDQANLADQEIARMMAEQYLGESGEQWMKGEIADSTAVLSTGLQSANAAIEIANTAKKLTSTQDVAKAVAEQGGQNAILNSAILQMQAQNQASLLQLQQLTSSSIQLAANNSEGIDEANRRERAERSNALNKSASEFIYVPGIFDDPSTFSP